MMGHQTGTKIAIKCHAEETPEVFANSNQIVQVFINFLQNSIDAVTERIARQQDLKPDISVLIANEGSERVMVTVRDNGIGIEKEDIGKIFDPFYTSKDVGQGMGLGLSITHQILQMHDVKVEVVSRPMDFTEIRMLFPTNNSAENRESKTTPTNERGNCLETKNSHIL